jgi:hypothetical protein
MRQGWWTVPAGPPRPKAPAGQPQSRCPCLLRFGAASTRDISSSVRCSRTRRVGATRRPSEASQNSVLPDRNVTISTKVTFALGAKERARKQPVAGLGASARSMTKSEQYAANARECRKMAQRAARADQKASWIWLEQSWLAMVANSTLASALARACQAPASVGAVR